MLMKSDDTLLYDLEIIAQCKVSLLEAIKHLQLKSCSPLVKNKTFLSQINKICDSNTQKFCPKSYLSKIIVKQYGITCIKEYLVKHGLKVAVQYDTDCQLFPYQWAKFMNLKLPKKVEHRNPT